MNLGAWPVGVPYDPAAGVESLELEAIISGPGAIWSAVLLGVGERARRSGWGARAALSIAGAWAAGGRRVILADLCLEQPELHEHLDEANGEGLADVFLFGASLVSVTRRGDDRAFEFLPPGAYIPDPHEIYTSDAWNALLRRLDGEGAVLLAYAPLEAAGVAELAKRLGESIVLAADPDTLREGGVLENARVQLVLRPASALPLVDPAEVEAYDEAEADEPGIARRPPPETDDEAADDEREALIADLRLRQREAMLVPPPDTQTPADPERSTAAGESPRPAPAYPARPPELDVPPTEPDFAAADQPKPRRRDRRRTIIVALLVVAVLSGVAGAWRLFSGMAEQRRAAQETAVPADAAADVPAGSTAALVYSVAIEAHPNLPTALDRIDALRAEDGRFNFYITPILVDGVVYYRLMAGPVADSTAAADMMAALVAAGHKTAASELDVRQTPLAFQLGSTATRAEAERRVEDLRTLAIPAYIVLDATPEGAVFRVYGGGYSGAVEAEVMRELLRTAGQADSLVTRTGRTTQ